VVNTQVDGWTVLTQSIDVDQSGKNDNLRVRVVKSLWGVLTAEMKFTKDSYAPGDLAHVTVTLSNSGASPLTGIVAYCNREVHSHALRGLAWGDLSSWSRGVTVPPGRTKTFDVTEHVPDGAFRAGFVVAGCRFGHYGDGNFYDMPEARDTAPVPGGIGTIKGAITYYPQGPGGPAEPVAGARVVVVDERPCHVAEQLTAKDGGFEFVNLRAGPGYSLYFYPPAGWRMLDKNPVTQFWVSDGDISMTETEAGKGEGQLPALPAEAAGCRPGPTTSSEPPANNPPATDPPTGPAPQARPAGPDLANTGADDVPMLAALGVLAVLLGSGLMLATRRRDTSR
jgi:LPXTG-motif cell wall-anchored protein